MRHKRIATYALAGSLTLFSTACSNMPDVSKTMQGTVGGAVAGAAIGAQAGGARGALVGAIVGGFIGNRIGNYLDEQDMKKLEKLEMDALRTGKAQSFVAQKSNEKVTITPGPVLRETLATYAVSPSVTSHPLELASRVEVPALVDTPVYQTTNTRERPSQVVKKGQPLRVPAVVGKDKRWGAVVEGETVVGYVPVSYLNSKTARAYVPPVAAKPVAKKPAAAKPAAESAGPVETAQPAALASEPRQLTAAVVGNCKVSVRRVKDTVEELKYCNEPPKGWQKVVA